MKELKDFTTSTARPLPVIIVADISGSMAEGGKIMALNQCIREMLETFRDEQDLRAEIHVAVLTFGNSQTHWQLPPGPASQATWTDMKAKGNTPMARAFQAVTDLLQDRKAIPSRAYRPTVVLVSDGEPTDDEGMPTDNWKAPLEALLASERGGKAQRLALGIGADANLTVLAEFMRGSEARVMRAEDGEARKIRKFFRFVTMSVTARSRSANPNTAQVMSDDEEWES